MVVDYDRNIVKEAKVIYADEQTDRRYRLDLLLVGEIENPKSLPAILMNPSKANEEVSDPTVNRLAKYVFLNRKNYPELTRVNRIILTNLYAVYETYPVAVNNLINDKGLAFVIGIEDGARFNNNKIINEAINESDIVLIGWGKGSIGGYRSRANCVFDFLEGKDILHVKNLTKDKYPRHARNWSFAWPLEKYE